MSTTVTTSHLGRGHLKPLDGVRGLAILMVICSHAFQANFAGGGRFAIWVGDLLGYGIFGVDLFFVLSGFLITGILVDSVGGPRFFSNFYARRVLRIFPLYYAVLLVLFLLTAQLHLQWHGMGWLMLGYLQNFRIGEIGTFSPGAQLGMNHFWSLAVEEQFYLIWPAVVFLVRDRRSLLGTTLAISTGALLLRLLLVRAGVPHDAIHVSTLTRADSLLLGGALALLYRTRAWTRVTAMAPVGFLVAGGAIVVSIGALGPDGELRGPNLMAVLFWVEGVRYTVLALASAFLIAWSLVPGSRCGWIFERPWLRFLGKYSYGIYVLHMVPLALLVAPQRAFLLRLTHSRVIAVAGAGVSTLGLAIVAAYISFHLYEKRFLRLKRFFDDRPQRARAGGKAGVSLAGANLLNS